MTNILGLRKRSAMLRGNAGFSLVEMVCVIAIGAALAHRFHDAGNTVIIAGRRPEALDAAWREWITGEWTLVVVGDAASIVDGLRELGRGEVTVVPA